MFAFLSHLKSSNIVGDTVLQRTEDIVADVLRRCINAELEINSVVFYYVLQNSFGESKV